MRSPLKPVLTVDTLRETFEALRVVAPVPDSPFLSFVLVQRHLHTPTQVDNLTFQQHVIFELLTEVVVQELARLRTLFQLPAPDQSLDLEGAKADLQQDGTKSSSFLLGCSVIYYRYIRAELDLSMQEIADAMGREERHLRRRSRQFLQHLVRYLLKLEQKARHEERQLDCLLALPRQKIATLATQQEIIQLGLQHLADTGPRALLLYGVPGIGKSTLALRLSEILVKEQHIGDVVWLHLDRIQDRVDRTAQTLMGLVSDALLVRGDEQTSALQLIRGYLRVFEASKQKLLVVLDGADNWDAAIRNAWDWLSHCIVIVTLQSQMSVWSEGALQCLHLSAEDTYEYIEFLQTSFRPRKKLLSTDKLYLTIWDAVGGNPGAIRDAYRFLAALPPDADIAQTQTVLRQYYADVWTTLDTIARQVWLAIDFLAITSAATYEQIVEFCQTIFLLDKSLLDRALPELIHACIVEAQIDDSEGYLYTTAPAVREAVIDTLQLLIDDIAQRVIHSEISAEIGQLAFHILQLPAYAQLVWPSLAALTKQAHRFVSSTGHWEEWLFITERFTRSEHLLPTHRLRFQLESATALRWLGSLDQALERVDAISSESRRLNDRILLGETLLEKSRLMLYKNRASIALHIAQEALDLFEELQKPEPIEESRVAILRALIQLDTRQARHWVDSIQERNAVTWELITRLEVQLGNKQAAMLAAWKCLEAQRDHEPGYARGLGVLAEALLLNGDTRGGIQRYEQAINLLQRKRDIVGLARMYNNFGAALINNRNLKRAKEQVLAALDLHEKLQDTHGRKIAEDNLALIEKLNRL